MSKEESPHARVLWARLRFSIVGPLLSAPPERGELKSRIEELSKRMWIHPTSKEPVRFGVSTIERWYYEAKSASDPIEELARKVPSHAGTHPAMPKPLHERLLVQYHQHRRWSYQLHNDNLQALVKEDPTLGPMPSYGTVVRVMKAEGLLRQKKPGKRYEDKTEPLGENLDRKEKRSFEVAHVNALWHSDYHEGSRRVLLPSGGWAEAFALCVLDDRSRLACHLQWYLPSPCAETTVHGWSQAFQKRGLPRAMLHDQGKEFAAGEIVEGLSRLSILQHETLPYSPEQNGKQENFWTQVENRLVAMLEGEKELTLDLLNQATQAWVELEYNRAHHSEIHESPLECFLREKNVTRPCPTSDDLRRCFRVEERRKQRKSDGTITVEGVRFELPSRYRSLVKVTLRVTRWDLSTVEMVDPRTGAHLATLLPIDKQANADGRRRTIDPFWHEQKPSEQGGIAPRLRMLIAEYAATGLPPAYLKFSQENEPNEGEPK